MPLSVYEGVGTETLLGYLVHSRGGVGGNSLSPEQSGLVVGSPVMGNTAIPATLAEIFAIDSPVQGHTADAVALGAAGNLVGVNANQGETAAPATMSITYLLGAANATEGETATPTTVPLTYVLGVANATQGENGLAVEIFTPTMLPDLKLWLSPESGVVVSANKVAQWTDKSGIANHATQVIASSMPFYISAVANGFNVLEFRTNPTNERLYATNVAAVSAVAGSGASKWSYAAVFETSSVTQNQRLWQAGIVSGASTNVFAVGVSSNYVTYNAGANSTTLASSQSFGSSKAATPTVLRVQSSGGNINAWENGVKIANVHLSGCGNMGIGAAPQMVLGNDGGSNVNQFLGWMAEVIVAATAFGSAHGRELDKLLGKKFGITIT